MPFRVMAGVTLLLVVLAACGGGRQQANQSGAIGEEVTDGQFTFTVTEWECGAREVSRGILRATAIGTYCFLSVRVANTGDEPRRFAPASQRVIDDEGRKFDAAVQETLIMSPDGVAGELNPGLAIEAVLVFDVAAPFSIVEAELHDALLSRGAVVTLKS